MMRTVAVVAMGHGAHSGLGGLLGVIAHAVIYSTVARLIWHAPLTLVAVLVIVACAYLLLRHTRDQS